MCWLQLENDLLQRVTSLVQHSDTDFWRKGRFLVCVNRQLVSYKDGMLSYITFVQLSFFFSSFKYCDAQYSISIQGLKLSDQMTMIIISSK